MLRTDVLRSMLFVDVAISVEDSAGMSGSLTERVYEVLPSDREAWVLRLNVRPYLVLGFWGRQRDFRNFVGINLGSGYWCLNLETKKKARIAKTISNPTTTIII